MKSQNIVKKLKREGYDIGYHKFEYWENIPCVNLEHGQLSISSVVSFYGFKILNAEFKYGDILEAIRVARANPGAIKDMGDYFQYKELTTRTRTRI